MGFKFDADAKDVNAFRAIVAKARALDEAIDRNELTPDEAEAALDEFWKKNPVPAPPKHVKEHQAAAKKAEDDEKAAEAKAAKEAAKTGGTHA